MTVKTKTDKTVGANKYVNSIGSLRRRSRIKVGVGERTSDTESNSADANHKSTDAVADASLNSKKAVPRHPKSQPAVAESSCANEISDGDCGFESTADRDDARCDIERRSVSILPEIIGLSRSRRRHLKIRISLEHLVLAAIKTEFGYGTWLTKEERDAIGKRAKNALTFMRGESDGSEVSDDDRKAIGTLTTFLEAQSLAIEYLNDQIQNQEELIKALVEHLPIAAWLHAREQRGFAAVNLANILGETGDLSFYSSPAKVWKRMGCAPYKGKTCSSHRREGSLTAKEWTLAGYSPQRRSVVYNVAEGLVKQNMVKAEGVDLPYRARYVEAKAKAKIAHPDWPKQRLRLHANLLCGKRLLLELWKEWTRLFGVKEYIAPTSAPTKPVRR